MDVALYPAPWSDGNTWHLDGVFVKIQGRQPYLWRAVDEDGRGANDFTPLRIQPRRFTDRVTVEWTNLA